MVVERARQTTDGSGMALTRRNQARSLEFAAGYEERERGRMGGMKTNSVSLGG